LSVEDSLRGVGSFFLYEPEAGFFKNLQVLFHGAVGPLGLRPIGGIRAYAPEGGGTDIFNLLVSLRTQWDFTPLENQQRMEGIDYSSEMVL